MGYFRYVKQVQKPTQKQLLYFTHRTELAWNEELWTVHYGEDGPGCEIVTTRQMFIDFQHDTYNDFQQWFLDELMEDYML